MLLTDESQVRKVIHDFNRHGFDSLRPRFGGGRPRRISSDDEARIVALAGARPDALGVPYTRWSLAKLSRYRSKAQIDDQEAALELDWPALDAADRGARAPAGGGRMYPALRCLEGKGFGLRGFQRAPGTALTHACHPRPAAAASPLSASGARGPVVLRSGPGLAEPRSR
jgi:hypothetical protein